MLLVLSRVARSLAPDPKSKSAFSVGGPLLTTAFWAIFSMFVGALFLTPILPFGDYPYHLALASILRRLLTPGSPEHALYETNLLTYNSLFHIAVALLAFVIPVRWAGLVVAASFWLILSLATIALLRATRQPTSRAIGIFPAFVMMPFTWGFMNFCIGTAIQLYALARTIGRPRVGAKVSYDLVTAFVVILGVWSHLLGSAIVYALAFVALLVRMHADKDPLLVRFGRTIREGLPYLPALALVALIYWREEHGPVANGDEPDADLFAIKKVMLFFSISCDFLSNRLDMLRVEIGAALLTVCAFFRAVRGKDPYPTLRLWLLATAGAIYLIMPASVWATAILFHRLVLVVYVLFLVWVPLGIPLVEGLVAWSLAVLGLTAGLGFVYERRAMLPDAKDFEAVLKAAPPHRSITGDIRDSSLEGSLQPWGGHLVAFYVAYGGLESSVNYADKMSLPVRYKRGFVALDAPRSARSRYQPTYQYAKRFDLVLIRTAPGDGIPAMAKGAERGRLVAHRGRYWLFDVKGAL